MHGLLDEDWIVEMSILLLIKYVLIDLFVAIKGKQYLVLLFTEQIDISMVSIPIMHCPFEAHEEYYYFQVGASFQRVDRGRLFGWVRQMLVPRSASFFVRGQGQNVVRIEDLPGCPPMPPFIQHRGTSHILFHTHPAQRISFGSCECQSLFFWLYSRWD